MLSYNSILIVPGAKDAYEQMLGNPWAAASKTARVHLAPEQIYLLAFDAFEQQCGIYWSSECLQKDEFSTVQL